MLTIADHFSSLVVYAPGSVPVALTSTPDSEIGHRIVIALLNLFADIVAADAVYGRLINLGPIENHANVGDRHPVLKESSTLAKANLHVWVQLGLGGSQGGSYQAYRRRPRDWSLHAEAETHLQYRTLLKVEIGGATFQCGERDSIST